MRRRRRRSLFRDIIIQRLKYLYGIAEDEARKGNIEYASQLGRYMKKLSMHSGVRIPRSIKRKLCKNCGLPLIPGLTARIRIRTQGRFSYVVVTCKKCGWIHRYPYKKGRGNEKGKTASKRGAPQQPRRNNRKERGDTRSTQRNRQQVGEEASGKGPHS